MLLRPRGGQKNYIHVHNIHIRFFFFSVNEQIAENYRTHTYTRGKCHDRTVVIYMALRARQIITTDLIGEQF